MKNFISDETGATAIEYSLIVSAIALAIITIIFLLGDQVVLIYDDVLAAL